MKNLAIIAYSRKAVNEYRNLFEKILGSRVLITTYCMEDGSIYQPIPAGREASEALEEYESEP